MIEQLHQDHFQVVLHAVILADKLRGSASDRVRRCRASTRKRPDATGTPTAKISPWGWMAGGPTKAIRWTSPRAWRATACTGRVRRSTGPTNAPTRCIATATPACSATRSFLWSGDVYSTWETLKTQVPIAINTSLTGIPYWGTDIGGFVPTKEFTAELYLRWFQFGAFCTLFRSHGRTWKLRLPWGWNTGDPGPRRNPQLRRRRRSGCQPTAQRASRAHLPQSTSSFAIACCRTCTARCENAPRRVCRSCAHCGCIIQTIRSRSLAAIEYLWGRNILVAPVVEKGATTRRVYLPRGDWYDFWTNERVEGGREINRAVDLETMPLYVAAGTILPLGPVKQYTGEEQRIGRSRFCIYPGANGSFLLYEDDGRSFDYRKGEWMGTRLNWNDARRTLTLNLEPGSRMLGPLQRTISVKLLHSEKTVAFNGKPVQVKF